MLKLLPQARRKTPSSSPSPPPKPKPKPKASAPEAAKAAKAPVKTLGAKMVLVSAGKMEKMPGNSMHFWRNHGNSGGKQLKQEIFQRSDHSDQTVDWDLGSCLPKTDGVNWDEHVQKGVPLMNPRKTITKKTQKKVGSNSSTFLGT